MKLFALYGLKGSGRDSAARIIKNLSEKAGYEVYTTAFSNKARFCIMDAFMLQNEREYDALKRGSITMPDGRIVSGKTIAKSISEHMREINDEEFIADVEYNINSLPQKSRTIVIITDLKFKEELKWCKENDAIIIKITREGVYEEGHYDEHEIEDFFCDYVVENTDTESDLIEKITYIFERHV